MSMLIRAIKRSYTLLLALCCASTALLVPNWRHELQAAGYSTAPEAVDDSAITSESQAVLVNVLTNDIGSDLRISSVSTPAHGSVIRQGSGTLVYTPKTGYKGSDKFFYTISNDQGSSTAHVVITVNHAAPIVSGLSGNQQEMAIALASACTHPGPQLEARCEQIKSLPESERRQAIAAITPSQVAAQAAQFIKLNSSRMINVQQRLSALRHGGGGVDISLNLNGKNLDLDKLAQSLATQKGGGAGDAFRDSPLGFFLHGRYGTLDQSATREERGFDSTTAGLTLGADYRFNDRFVLGLAFGYDSTSSRFNAEAGNMDTESRFGTLYASYFLPQDFYLDFMANYGNHSYDLRRSISYSGFDATARSKPQGDQLGFSLNFGKDFAFSEWNLNPYARLEYAKLQIGSYQEKGGSGLAMAFGSQNLDSLVTDVGAQIGRTFGLPWGVLTPSLRVEWEHQFENGAHRINGSFLGGAAGTGAFSILTSGTNSDYVNLGGSVAATFAEGRSAFLRYETRLGQSAISSHKIELGVRIPF
ncbi:MAG: autotransporter domain-containing protein [Methylococcaceae bacterium]|nr:autotransporter domain-containing protein [Methylococcaceae bacterium]